MIHMVIYILFQYYRDFPLYNPAEYHRSKSKSLNQSYKIYAIDEPGQENRSAQNDKRAILAAAARRRDAGQNERYYNEVGRHDI